MTTQTRFHNWSQAPLQPDPRRCSDLLTTLNRDLRDRWAGQDLGCYTARRIVDGTKPSAHASGAATDWRYESPGCGRSRMLDEAMPWLLGNSLELGIDAVHDYVGGRIWRPPGTSGRRSGGVEAGWRPQTRGGQMGQPWALWIHVEVLDSRWGDTRSIDEMLASAPTPQRQPPPTPLPTEEDDMLGLVRLDSNPNAVYVVDGVSARLVRADEMDELTSNLRYDTGFRYYDLTQASRPQIRDVNKIPSRSDDQLQLWGLESSESRAQPG